MPLLSFKQATGTQLARAPSQCPFSQAAAPPTPGWPTPHPAQKSPKKVPSDSEAETGIILQSEDTHPGLGRVIPTPPHQKAFLLRGENSSQAKDFPTWAPGFLQAETGPSWVTGQHPHLSDPGSAACMISMSNSTTAWAQRRGCSRRDSSMLEVLAEDSFGGLAGEFPRVRPRDGHL